MDAYSDDERNQNLKLTTTKENPFGPVYKNNFIKKEVINSGIQPIQNLRVMQRLGSEFNFDKAQQQTWSRGWIESGFRALEALVAHHGETCCYGHEVSFADLCLIPQLYNARRFSVDLSMFPRLTEIEARLAQGPAFIDAHPDQQSVAV